jgi:hypothetical protein
MSTFYSTMDRNSPQQSAQRAEKEEEVLSEAKERISNHSNNRKGTVAARADVTQCAELESPSPVSYAAAPTFIRDDDSSQECKDAASTASCPLSFSSHFLDRRLYTKGEPSQAIQFNSAPHEDNDSDDASSDFEDKKPKAKTSNKKKKTSRGGQKSKSSAKPPATSQKKP